MNEQDRLDRLDREAVAEDVDEFMDSLSELIGRRGVGHNAVPIRALAETLAVKSLRLPDRKTPLHNPKVALEDNRAIDGDERAPTRPLSPARRQGIGPRRGPR